MELGAGTFGENLTVAGFDRRAAWVGERWRIGTCLLERERAAHAVRGARDPRCERSELESSQQVIPLEVGVVIENLLVRYAAAGDAWPRRACTSLIVAPDTVARVGHVAQVVETQLLQVGRLHRRVPVSITEVALPQDGTVRARKHSALGIRTDELQRWPRSSATSPAGRCTTRRPASDAA